MKKLMSEGIYFIVVEAGLKYASPGRYGDVLSVETTIDRIGPASIIFRHRVLREETGEHLVEATVKLACVGESMRPMRLRQDIIEAASEDPRDRHSGSLQ